MSNVISYNNVPTTWARPPLPYIGTSSLWTARLPTLNALIDETQNNIQAPRPLILNAALTAVSLAQQGLIDVRKPNGQVVPTSLMLLAIANSGERKSSAESVFLKPIRTFQANQKVEYQTRLKKWRAEHEIWKIKRKAILKKVAKAASEGQSDPEEEQRLIAHDCEEPKKPREFKLLYEDSTSEALFYGLYQHLPTAGLTSSEGAGILSGAALNDLSKQNAIWSGDSITVDRKSQPSFELTDARLTVSLMVQEPAFRQYLQKHGEVARGSGLWARFLVCQPMSTQGSRFVGNGTQSWAHEEKFAERLTSLLQENVILLDEPARKKQVVGFTSEASERWVQVLNAIESEIRMDGRFNNAGDHASKLADNIARISAHFHWFEQFDGDISLETLEVAISVCFYYSDEFLRLFLAPSQASIDARDLNAWLDRHRMSGKRYIRRNHVRQCGPNALRDKKRLEAAINILQVNNFIFPVVVRKIGCLDLLPREPYNDIIAQYNILGEVDNTHFKSISESSL